MSDTGMLYLVATPIGNLEDMTFRAVKILKEADLIAAEDTRNSRKLLTHFEIHTPMTSYHEYNKIGKAHELVGKMLSGMTVALITDAGTPAISDPGEDLVRIAYEAGIRVSAVPGACACITALTLSGLPTGRFCFEAFLPWPKKERQAVLEELKRETRTILIYEAPHRLVRTLRELLDALGERRITLCRELTKIHEEALLTTLSEALLMYSGGNDPAEDADGYNEKGETDPGEKTTAGGSEERQPRGEYVLVIEGCSSEQLQADARKKWENVSLQEHMEYYLLQGQDKKAAMKSVAADLGISKREVYGMLLKTEQED